MGGAELERNGIAFSGDDTVINGQPPIKVHWNRAELLRIHQFFDDSEMKFPGYELTLPPETRNPPYSIKVGSEVRNLITGVRISIRDVDPPSDSNELVCIHAIGIEIVRRNE